MRNNKKGNQQEQEGTRTWKKREIIGIKKGKVGQERVGVWEERVGVSFIVMGVMRKIREERNTTTHLA
jgi:hypothetical protein